MVILLSAFEHSICSFVGRYCNFYIWFTYGLHMVYIYYINLYHQSSTESLIFLAPWQERLMLQWIGHEEPIPEIQMFKSRA